LSGDLADATHEVKLVAADEASSKPSRLRVPWKAVLGSVVFLMLLSFGYYMIHRRGEDDAAAARATAPRSNTLRRRRSVAVLGLKNMTARPEVGWLSTALSEMLATELAAGDEVRVIPEENVARMKLELGLADADTLSKDRLAWVRRTLGADVVVVGSYTALATAEGDSRRAPQSSASGRGGRGSGFHRCRPDRSTRSQRGRRSGRFQSSANDVRGSGGQSKMSVGIGCW
jgi:TolB-like protein